MTTSEHSIISQICFGMVGDGLDWPRVFGCGLEMGERAALGWWWA